LGHADEIGPKDFVIILTAILQLLLIGFTIYQFLPSAPKGNMRIKQTRDKIKLNS
jgi:hypothetical protein